ncbi:YncE family protein [Bacillus toyonensis]|uniref:YncE family protein n=1 Tax=Bacillus toyonensis TaxID=155322 RepID=UPI00253F828F|nr:hypothetical protein [Bacillus toyonensis]WIG34123.1 hypothetical protein QPL83_00035 [Bacillus toyonensis]
MQHLQIHILVGTSPRGVGVNPLTNRIYIANVTSNNVSVIDRITNTVITTILGFSWPFGIGVNP